MKAEEVARLMNRYARDHAAGAFGSPLAADLNKNGWHEWHDSEQTVVATVARLGRPGTRNDWTGRRYVIPAGASVATFIARTPGAGFPDDLASVDFAFGYADDPVLTRGFLDAGFHRYATRISASSEIITCWAHRGAAPKRAELAEDVPTAEPLPWCPSMVYVDRMRTELRSIEQWHDDYPFYSDGTWGAVNLRGFNPADPLWGVKPAEMPRKWQREHPEAMRYRCDWTTITDRLPTMRAVTEDLADFLGATDLERVRLMRMAAKPGGGALARHSDVTDKAAGTRDGQVARFHIPLHTHGLIKMSVWDLDGTRNDVHLPVGTCWYLDQRKPHAVVNPSTVDRVHLVVDVLCNDTVRKALIDLAAAPTP